jgi:hypothetical protein
VVRSWEEGGSPEWRSSLNGGTEEELLKRVELSLEQDDIETVAVSGESVLSTH